MTAKLRKGDYFSMRGDSTMSLSSMIVSVLKVVEYEYGLHGSKESE